MNRFLKYVFVTGLVAGALDITGAYIVQYFRTGKFADKLLHYIAAGWIGVPNAMKGGSGTALVGLLSHFLIATIFVLIFFVAYPRIKLLRGNQIITGLLYGLLIDLVMSRLVLPFSALHAQPVFEWSKYLVNALVVGIAIGIPAAIASAKYYASRAFNSAEINRK